MIASERMLSKLDLLVELTDKERTAVQALPFRISRQPAKADIVREGDWPSSSFIILEGFVATSKNTGEGARAITALHVPGDMPDLMSLHLPEMDCDVRAITNCVLAFVEHDQLRTLCREYPRLLHGLWKGTLIEAAVYRESVVNIGHRSALARLAHFFCEMMIRTNANQRKARAHFPLPLTQTDLADITGMSTVHVNRSLQSLRATNAISYDQGQVIIHRWEELLSMADFNPAYLHLPEEALTIGTDGHLKSLAPKGGA
ncbi:Crp/Fnr family transcriptional regulator [Mesorhizobium sp. YM1C-6-2]|uniref:Crp/Fnr family transcriptional regulator n=1 Tax=Mesorhizobium sp. YM1C-6-2 TaxID=1827501 RepID=UPI000EF1F0A5|nr:Crp/Fnr family transcriptional regulator [Mesorhizobium sp. YM1C-6-2]RLP24011.1 Crp/Fnr family transcriptional regulator [Mesorhizobium sp. YM1C-6-2]